MKILVTGCAGFIGSHLCERLLEDNHNIIGIDNLNDYYDINLKKTNLDILYKYKNFSFYKKDVCDIKLIDYTPDKVVHLASMAGVRYSINNPKLYIKNNIEGFVNILDECQKNNIKDIVYASSSSVYGLNIKIPFSEDDTINKCNSPYAASKLAMEIFAKTYSQLYNLSCIGLRFFTVYGSRGRPDMAPYKFLNSISNNIEFQKYGNGMSFRDYTYIDDIIDGILGAIQNRKNIKCEVYNLGNNKPVSLNDFINICEKVTGKKAKYKQIENQKGDVPYTCADIEKAKRDLNYNPQISLQDGLKLTFNYL